MATHSVNRTIRLPVGDLTIYVNPKQEEEAWRLIKKCPQILKKGYEQGCLQFAQKLLKIVKKSLNSGMPPPGQGVSWPEHSLHTIKKYGEHKLLNLTGQYAKMVAIRKQKKNGNIFVGLPPNVPKIKQKGKNQGSVYDGNLTLNQVALILEYGTNNMVIPPRPLWRPAWAASGGIKELRKVIRRNIQKEVRKYKNHA